MKIGDLSTDALAHCQEGAYGLSQKGRLGNELFHPVAEDVATRFADAQAQVLQQATDLVLEIALDLDQLGPTVQDRPDLMTREPLDLNFLVPTALHDPGQADGIVAVALVDLHRQCRLGMTGIDADHGQAKRS